jgi:hypothetical protein
MAHRVLMLMSLAYLLTCPVLAADTLCSKDEQTVFACTLGKNIVSVCASDDLSPTHGYVQYRFGPKNSPALSLPASTQISSRASIQARTLMFAGGGGEYMRFLNGRYQYIVYTAIGKGWGTKDGVAVEKDGKSLAHLICQDVPVSKLGQDFFTQAGLAEDQAEFVLP